MNAHLKKVSKMKKLTALSVLIAILAPTLVTATVILTYQYNVNSSYATPYLFLSTGENYNTANTLGLIYAKTQTSPSGGFTYIPSGTVEVNVSDGAYSEYLLNVLAVYNISSGLKVPVYAYINATNIPSGVTVYISNASLIFNGNTVTTTKGASLYTLTSTSPVSKAIPITTSSTTAPVLYIGFEISSTSTSPTPASVPTSFTLSVQFSVQ